MERLSRLNLFTTSWGHFFTSKTFQGFWSRRNLKRWEWEKILKEAIKNYWELKLKFSKVINQSKEGQSFSKIIILNICRNIQHLEHILYSIVLKLKIEQTYSIDNCIGQTTADMSSFVFYVASIGE